MKVLAIRFCSVSAQSEDLVGFFREGLGLPTRDTGEHAAEGAIFPAGESWIEIWKEGPDMPAGTMLQIVVDDADSLAQQARANGLEPQGPMDAHGERIYFLKAPTGLPVTFQSSLLGA
jgi:hypothetical protein